jgi:hypothetical protein
MSAPERTLRDALALSPAERVALAESLWRELGLAGERPVPWTAAAGSSRLCSS